jgi:hypothetical protein
MKHLHSLTLVGLAGSAALLSSCMFNTTRPPSEPVQTSVATVYTPGYTVATIPSGHTVVTRGGTRYYVVDGTYYRASSRGYVVVPRPL